MSGEGNGEGSWATFRDSHNNLTHRFTGRMSRQTIGGKDFDRAGKLRSDNDSADRVVLFLKLQRGSAAQNGAGRFDTFVKRIKEEV